MPELPEVEVVRRGIDAWATNRTISHVDVLHARSIRRCEGGAAELRAALKGDSFRCASRRPSSCSRCHSELPTRACCATARVSP